jgi:hypothetical protein
MFPSLQEGVKMKILLPIGFFLVSCCAIAPAYAVAPSPA